MNTSSTMAIETCEKCLGKAAGDQIALACVPVPYFGEIASKSLEVATIGLNPAWSEFYTNKGFALPRSIRLPLVEDYGRNSRKDLTTADLEDSTIKRDNYFVNPDRNWHPYFEKFEGIINRCNPAWSYALGSAIHFDLVACTTKTTWGKLNPTTKSVLAENCRPHFLNTLAQLPHGTALLLDGKRVFDEINNLGLRIEQTAPEPRYLLNELGYRGRLFYDGREYPLRAWHFYMNHMTTHHRAMLGYWLKTSFFKQLQG